MKDLRILKIIYFHPKTNASHKSYRGDVNELYWHSVIIILIGKATRKMVQTKNGRGPNGILRQANSHKIRTRHQQNAEFTYRTHFPRTPRLYTHNF